MSMTSLIDVIFLLLLFFMLSSTFSKFSDIELAAAGQSSGATSERPPLFLRLLPDQLSLNGRSLAINALAEALAPEADPEAPRVLLIAPGADVTAQRLTDLLVALRGVRGVIPTVLGGAT